jgi:hypothetical protein
MLPQVAQLEIKVDKNDDLPKIGKSFLFDFKTGEFKLADGKPVDVEGIDGLKIWIEKILRTEKYRYKIYERADKDEYGVVLEDLIVGNNFPTSFVEAEIKREISQALLRNPVIDALTNWKLSRERERLNISFKVNTVYGDSFNQEVNL